MSGRAIKIIGSWVDQAICKGRTELFFAGMHEKPSERRKREARAAKVCADCPVIYQCRLFARENGEHGFWGGESDEDRWKLGYLKDNTIRRRNKARQRRSSLERAEQVSDHGVS